MSREIRITLSEEEFEDLKEFKETWGLTWKGILVYGVLGGREQDRKFVKMIASEKEAEE